LNGGKQEKNSSDIDMLYKELSTEIILFPYRCVHITVETLRNFIQHQMHALVLSLSLSLSRSLTASLSRSLSASLPLSPPPPLSRERCL